MLSDIIQSCFWSHKVAISVLQSTSFTEYIRKEHSYSHFLPLPGFTKTYNEQNPFSRISAPKPAYDQLICICVRFIWDSELKTRADINLIYTQICTKWWNFTAVVKTEVCLCI